MKQKELDFSGLTNAYGGPLPPKDVSLFYYDICFDHATGNTFVYEWTKEIQDYLDGNGIVIKDCPVDAIPQSFESNKIFFSLIKSDEDNKAVAFFRHLRNTFAHYSIGYNGDYICMEDHETFGNHRPTMRGKIKYKFFEELVSIFFKQKAAADEEYKKYLYHES